MSEAELEKYRIDCERLAASYVVDAALRRSELELARKWVEKLQERSAERTVVKNEDGAVSVVTTARLNLHRSWLAHSSYVQLTHAEAGDNVALARIHFARVKEEIS